MALRSVNYEMDPLLELLYQIEGYDFAAMREVQPGLYVEAGTNFHNMVDRKVIVEDFPCLEGEDYHSGQTSELYAKQCRISRYFKPSPMHQLELAV
jgi:hypothetical protein